MWVVNFRKDITSSVRHCPNCNCIYPSGEFYKFCRNDGTLLLSPEEAREAATLQQHMNEIPTLDMHNEEVRVVYNPPAMVLAENLDKEIELQELRHELNNSIQGVQIAEGEVESLISKVEQQAQEINKSSRRVRVEIKYFGEGQLTIISSGCGVKISWQRKFANNLNDSRLVIVEYEQGNYDTPEKDLYKMRFQFYVHSDFQAGWYEKATNRFIISEKLASECINRLMTSVRSNLNNKT